MIKHERNACKETILNRNPIASVRVRISKPNTDTGLFGYISSVTYVYIGSAYTKQACSQGGNAPLPEIYLAQPECYDKISTGISTMHFK